MSSHRYVIGGISGPLIDERGTNTSEAYVYDSAFCYRIVAIVSRLSRVTAERDALRIADCLNNGGDPMSLPSRLRQSTTLGSPATRLRT